jgi:hypothetical protein
MARPVTSSRTASATLSPWAKGSGRVAKKTVCAFGREVEAGTTGVDAGVERAAIVGTCMRESWQAALVSMRRHRLAMEIL